MTQNSSFCLKENMGREAKEAARRQRLQELEEQKRHSWAGGEEVGGHTHTQPNTETQTHTNCFTSNELPLCDSVAGGRSIQVALQQRGGHVSCHVETRRDRAAGGASDH